MKIQKKFFITDFDGTLLKDDKTISCEDIKTLEILRQKKIFTAIATGRSAYSFGKALKDIGMKDDALPIDYVIFSTGAGIMEFPDGRVIYQKALPPLDIKKLPPTWTIENMTIWYTDPYLILNIFFINPMEKKILIFMPDSPFTRNMHCRLSKGIALKTLLLKHWPLYRVEPIWIP
jgi:hydroxymethylpyrimidine pyrophosphatase-like HAD family hydrolase